MTKFNRKLDFSIFFPYLFLFQNDGPHIPPSQHFESKHWWIPATLQVKVIPSATMLNIVSYVEYRNSRRNDKYSV